MSQRAAIIITDCDQVEVTDWCAESGKHQGYAFPSEQLLADLRRIVVRAVQRVDECEWSVGPLPGDRDAIARVRAVLPEEENDDA
jgi:hypothetical protein